MTLTAPLPAAPQAPPPSPAGALQTLKYLLLAMRPKQWTKNGVVFVAVVFAHRLGNPRAVGLALLAVLIFCLVSGVVYLVNDLVDLFGIAGGFLLRAAGGAWIIGVEISSWLYLCTLLGALFLGLGKRRHELLVLEGTAASHRKILGEYTTEFLEELISIVSSALLVSYALYTYFAYPTHTMMATVPFAVYGIFRYLYLVHLKSDGGAPEEILLRDRPLLGDIALWALTAGVILYFFSKP